MHVTFRRTIIFGRLVKCRGEFAGLIPKLADRRAGVGQLGAPVHIALARGGRRSKPADACQAFQPFGSLRFRPAQHRAFSEKLARGDLR